MLITNSTKFSKPNFVGKLFDFKIKGKTLFNVSGKEHALHRKLLNPYFSYGTVQVYIPIFTKIVDNLIKVGSAVHFAVSIFASSSHIFEPSYFILYFKV